MPFPLAHPAAVLPLRRYCPRFFSFPALVWGSLVPDLGYFFPRTWLEDSSHSWLGSLEFCLPVGLITLGLFYVLCRWIGRYRPDFLEWVFPQKPRSFGIAVGTAILSLLVGTWTHLFLDSFTHKNGWVVERVAMLQSPITQVDGRTVRVCHLLWYVASFLGVAWLYLTFRKHEERTISNQKNRAPRHILEAVLVASLVLPIELAHHLVRGIVGLVLVAALSVALVATILVRSQLRRHMAREGHD